MPSGPRKRKSAKRKMESLGSIGSNNGDSRSTPPTALLSRGNESESGGETASPTTPGESGFEREIFEFNSSAGAMDSSDSGGEKLAGEEAAVPQEAVLVSAHGDTEVPGSLSEDVGVERVETEKCVEIRNSEVEHLDVGIERKETVKGSGIDSSELNPSELTVTREEELGMPVPMSDATDIVEQTFSTSLEEAVAETEQIAAVPVEKVETSKSVEAPSDAKEVKVVSSSNASSTQASCGGERQLHAETGDIRNEVVIPPQAGHRTSWMNCCGLLDLFTVSH